MSIAQSRNRGSKQGEVKLSWEAAIVNIQKIWLGTDSESGVKYSTGETDGQLRYC